MDNREELYESLIRLGLMLIFMFSLTAGTFGLVSICHTLMRTHVARPQSSIHNLADAQ